MKPWLGQSCWGDLKKKKGKKRIHFKMKKVVVARGESDTMSDTSSIVWFPIFKPPAFGKITQILHMPQNFCVIEQKWCHDWLSVAFVSISGQRYVNCLQDKSVFIKMSNIKEQNCICSLFQMNPCFDVVFFPGGVGIVGYRRPGRLWQVEASLLPRYRCHPDVLLHWQPRQFRWGKNNVE